MSDNGLCMAANNVADIPGLSSVGGDVKVGMLVFLFTAVCTLQRAVSVTSQGPISICSMNECAKISIKTT